MRHLDFINVVMLAVMCAIALLTLPAAPGNWALLVAYAGMAALVLVYPRVQVPRMDFPKVFRRLYPVVYIAVIFDSMTHLVPYLHSWRADDLLMRIDRMIFGVDPTLFLEGWLNRAAVELLSYAYMIYFVLPFGLVWLLWRAGRLEEIYRWACLITLALYANYLLYFVFPAVGPRLYMEHSVKLEGLFFSDFLMSTLNSLEANKFDVFPSAHVNATLVTLYGFARIYRRYAAAAGAIALAIIVSTVYLRYHYVVDVAAGAVLAAGSVAAGEYFYRTWPVAAGRVLRPPARARVAEE